MSFREETSGGEEGGGGNNLRKPFLHTGSWYRMGMGSRQGSLMDKLALSSSAQVLRDSSVSVLFCTLIVALGPIQFGFTVCTPRPFPLSLLLCGRVGGSLMSAPLPSLFAGWLLLADAG